MSSRGWYPAQYRSVIRLSGRGSLPVLDYEIDQKTKDDYRDCYGKIREKAETGVRDVVTVTIPSITCAMSATRLVVERTTMLLAFLYPVQATTAVPNTKTPTTKLNSLCESSITSSGLFSEGKTAPSHNGQDSPQPSPELLVVTYPPMTIKMYVETTEP